MADALVMQSQQPTNRSQASAFQIQLEDLPSEGLVVACGLGVGGEIVAAGLRAEALRASAIEAALDDVVVLLAVWASWILHKGYAIIALLLSLLPSDQNP